MESLPLFFFHCQLQLISSSFFFFPPLSPLPLFSTPFPLHVYHNNISNLSSIGNVLCCDEQKTSVLLCPSVFCSSSSEPDKRQKRKKGKNILFSVCEITR